MCYALGLQLIKESVFAKRRLELEIEFNGQRRASRFDDDEKEDCRVLQMHFRDHNSLRELLRETLTQERVFNVKAMLSLDGAKGLGAHQVNGEPNCECKHK